MRKSFLRYLEMESNQPEQDRSGDGEVCYNFRPEGFCGERTAWVCHLMAGEYYDQAIHANGVEKKTYLEQAAKYVECERKRFPSADETAGREARRGELVDAIVNAIGCRGDHDVRAICGKHAGAGEADAGGTARAGDDCDLVGELHPSNDSTAAANTSV